MKMKETLLKGKEKIRSVERKIISKEEGMGVVEVILIVLVFIGLASLFKREITTVANTIFLTIKTQVGSF